MEKNGIAHSSIADHNKYTKLMTIIVIIMLILITITYIYKHTHAHRTTQPRRKVYKYFSAAPGLAPGLVRMFSLVNGRGRVKMYFDNIRE